MTRILVTRPAGRADGLTAALTERGFEPVHSPFIEFSFEDSSDLREAMKDLAHGEFDYLLLTSVTTIQALQALPEWTELPAVQEFKAAAVGEATAKAAREAGIEVEVIAKGSAESLIEVFPPNAQAADGLEPRIFYPVSSAAAPQLELALRMAGYQVQRETAYRPRVVQQSPEVLEELASGGFAAVVATSPMIVRELSKLRIAEGTRIIVIGKPSYEAAISVNLPVTEVAKEPSDEALAAAVATALS